MGLEQDIQSVLDGTAFDVLDEFAVHRVYSEIERLLKSYKTRKKIKSFRLSYNQSMNRFDVEVYTQSGIQNMKVNFKEER